MVTTFLIVTNPQPLKQQNRLFCWTEYFIQNYKPAHLGAALTFLGEHHEKYPYTELVGKTHPLSRINQAVEAAESGKYIRVGIR